jgi:hypothetical protein
VPPMKLCPTCGAELAATAAACPVCGCRWLADGSVVAGVPQRSPSAGAPAKRRRWRAGDILDGDDALAAASCLGDLACCFWPVFLVASGTMLVTALAVTAGPRRRPRARGG